jgi:hypothetical protein
MGEAQGRSTKVSKLQRDFGPLDLQGDEGLLIFMHQQLSEVRNFDGVQTGRTLFASSKMGLWFQFWLNTAQPSTSLHRASRQHKVEGEIFMGEILDAGGDTINEQQSIMIDKFASVPRCAKFHLTDKDQPKV